MGLLYLFRNMPVVVKNLFIINFLVFLAGFVAKSWGLSLPNLLGMKYFGSVFFQPYQIFTHMFTHGGFSHIVFNMFGLLMFGSVVERYIGSKRFLILYLLSGLGSAFLEQFYWAYKVYDLTGGIFPARVLQDQAIHVVTSGIMDPLGMRLVIPMVGASGAIYGLLATYAFLFPNAELMLIFFPFPIKAKYFVPGLMVLDLFLGVSNYSWDNIAHFAHLGGAITGFILIFIWRNRSF
jgi:membrane associated rhomboid family serine protease